MNQNELSGALKLEIPEAFLDEVNIMQEFSIGEKLYTVLIVTGKNGEISVNNVVQQLLEWFDVSDPIYINEWVCIDVNVLYENPLPRGRNGWRKAKVKLTFVKVNSIPTIPLSSLADFIRTADKTPSLRSVPSEAEPT